MGIKRIFGMTGFFACGVLLVGLLGGLLGSGSGQAWAGQTGRLTALTPALIAGTAVDVAEIVYKISNPSNQVVDSGTLLVNSNGSWSQQLSTPLLPGNYSVFARSGAGTVLVQETVSVASLGACLTVEALGGKADGLTDNSPLLQSALSQLGGTGGCIAFGSGIYRFNEAVTYNFPASGPFSVRLVGTGQDATTLYFPSGGGMTFNYSLAMHSVHFADLSITTGSKGAGSAITLYNSSQLGAFAQTDFRYVTIRPEDSGFANYWATGINVQGVSNINFDTVLIYGSATSQGTGVYLAGVAGGFYKYGVIYNIDKCGFFSLQYGLYYGTYIQGVAVSNTNFQNGQVGIFSGPSEVGLAQLSVVNSQFGVSAYPIETLTAIDAMLLSNNLFYVNPGQVGLYLVQAAAFNITGNYFSYGTTAQAATNGIVVGQNGGIYGIITGNTFLGLTTGIWLQGGASYVNVQSNAYESTIGHVANQGTGNTVGGGSD